MDRKLYAMIHFYQRLSRDAVRLIKVVWSNKLAQSMSPTVVAR